MSGQQAHAERKISDQPSAMTNDITPPQSMREEIERRVAAFRERQRRFNQARDDHFRQTFARLRADLDRTAPIPANGRDAPVTPSETPRT